MIRLLAATAAAALLTVSTASAQLNQPGNPDSMKDSQAQCPAGTTDKNCQEQGRSSTEGGASGSTINTDKGVDDSAGSPKGAGGSSEGGVDSR